MESIKCQLDSESFDKAIHGGLDDKPVLAECGDLAVFVKPNATVGGNAMAVVTFTVQLPDGTLARAQAATTAALLEMVARCIAGWRSGGHIT